MFWKKIVMDFPVKLKNYNFHKPSHGGILTYISTFTCSVPVCEEVLAAQNKVFKLLRVFKILLVKVYIFNKKKDSASSFSNHGDILTNMIVP